MQDSELKIHDQLEDWRPEQARRSAAGAGGPGHDECPSRASGTGTELGGPSLIMMVRVRQPRSLSGLRVSGRHCRLELTTQPGSGLVGASQLSHEREAACHCILTQYDCILSQNDCISSQNDCISSQRDCIFFSSQNDCLLTQNDCIASQNDCISSQIDCILSQRGSHFKKTTAFQVATTPFSF